MTDFVPVPVPSEHVLAVMRYITDLSSDASDSSAPPPPVTPGASPSPGGVWSVPNLQRLARGENTSTMTIAKILDDLSPAPTVTVALGDLADRIGVTPENLRGSLSGFTRHMRNKYPDEQEWPFGWDRGPHLSEANPTEYHYYVSGDQAQQWLTARTQPDVNTDPDRN